MTSQSRSAPVINENLAKRDLAEYGVARFRDQAFDAVLALWRRRQKEGWTQKRVADTIKRDPGWVSRNLRAPGNWTLRIMGELVQGLEGESEIVVAALEDPVKFASNSDAYDAYDGYISSSKSISPPTSARQSDVKPAIGVITSDVEIRPKQMTITVTRGGFPIPGPNANFGYERVM